jgi:uncharacterized membrane protein
VKRVLLISLAVIITSIAVFSQNVSFVASAPRVVETGEQFEVTYTLTAQPSSFTAPEFKGFNLIGGPSTSSSSSVQFVNGKVNQSSSYSYTYYFMANTAGTFTIEPAKAKVDGKIVTSNSLTIQVAGGGQGANAQTGGQQGNAGQQPQSTSGQEIAAESGNDDLFIRVLVDKNSIYQGEHVIASIKLFSKYGNLQNENVEFPSFNGFFRQDIESANKSQLIKEVVNGQVYFTALIEKMALFPQKSGEITIDPMTMQLLVQVPVKGNRRRSVFDDFFGPQVQEVRKKISSKQVKIFVRPLPANAPETFKGAVGNLSFKASFDKQNVKTNDAINLKISITGNGNLKMIEPFDIKFPSDFEAYDPKTTVNVTTNANGANGSKTFEYLVIPRHSGNFKIDPIEFTYFDTQSKQYKTISAGPFDINVEKGANESASTVVSGVSKEDVKFLGRDIQYIKTQKPTFTKKGEYFVLSLKFWLFYIVSILLFIASIVLWQKRIRENANIVFVKNKRANKVAHKRLKDAHIFMKDNKKEEFYEYILKAMWGYMSDKLSIPVSELSREKVLESSESHKISQELTRKFLEVLDTCEFARYAPTEGTSQMDAVYKDSIEIISKIEQVVR